MNTFSPDVQTHPLWCHSYKTKIGLDYADLYKSYEYSEIKHY